MSLASGTRLGPYEILAPLGAGGMGEVYRARDTKLDRDVAIKVLPAALARDPERLARFEREAKVLASLNHPNIAQIYGVAESGDVRALVMELVDGQTLAEALGARGRGPEAIKNAPAQGFPLEVALGYAQQIVDALTAAHDKGITHRDLKPANVMITREGVVKVLDFGLAAVTQPASGSDANATHSPTLTMSPTSAGMILGTAAYMSPEQARGQIVDRRADIWAFGVVLWEMLTGRQLFRGDTVSDILASVLKEEPDFSQVPAQVWPLLKRCLEKEPRKRLQAIGDWDLLLSRDEPIASTAPSQSRLGNMAWITTGVFAVAAIALGLVSYRHVTEEAPRVLKMSILPPEKGAFKGNSLPAVSPDGRRLAFVATLDGKVQLWVRDLHSLAARALTGTEGADEPFWSPDSRSVAFFAGGKLKKIDVAGGPALTLCDATGGRGGTWNKDGVIVFGVFNGAIFRVLAAGGSATAVTAPEKALGEVDHRFPWFLPDRRHFLYTATNDTHRQERERGTIYAGDVDSKNGKLILTANSNAVYTPPGYLLFVRDRTLMAQPFDAGKLQTTGDAIPIAERVDSVGGRDAQNQFSISRNGGWHTRRAVEAEPPNLPGSTVPVRRPALSARRTSRVGAQFLRMARPWPWSAWTRASQTSGCTTLLAAPLPV